MFRRFFRFFSLLFLICGVIAAILDAARSVGASYMSLTSFGAMLANNNLVDVSDLQLKFIIQFGASLWEFVDGFVMQSPAWAVFGGLALIFYVISYRRPKRFKSQLY